MRTGATSSAPPRGLYSIHLVHDLYSCTTCTPIHLGYIYASHHSYWVCGVSLNLSTWYHETRVSRTYSSLLPYPPPGAADPPPGCPPPSLSLSQTLAPLAP